MLVDDIHIGVAADKATRQQVEAALLLSEPGAEFVVELVQPKPASGLGALTASITTKPAPSVSIARDVVRPIAEIALAIGGQIGSALISKDAEKYAIKKSTQVELAIATGNQQAQLKALEAQLAAQRTSEEFATARSTHLTTALTALAAGSAKWVGLSAFALGALWIVTRR